MEQTAPLLTTLLLLISQSDATIPVINRKTTESKINDIPQTCAVINIADASLRIVQEVLKRLSNNLHIVILSCTAQNEVCEAIPQHCFVYALNGIKEKSLQLLKCNGLVMNNYTTPQMVRALSEQVHTVVIGQETPVDVIKALAAKESVYEIIIDSHVTVEQIQAIPPCCTVRLCNPSPTVMSRLQQCKVIIIDCETTAEAAGAISFNTTVRIGNTLKPVVQALQNTPVQTIGIGPETSYELIFEIPQQCSMCYLWSGVNPKVVAALNNTNIRHFVMSPGVSLDAICELEKIENCSVLIDEKTTQKMAQVIPKQCTVIIDNASPEVTEELRCESVVIGLDARPDSIRKLRFSLVQKVIVNKDSNPNAVQAIPARMEIFPYREISTVVKAALTMRESRIRLLNEIKIHLRQNGDEQLLEVIDQEQYSRALRMACNCGRKDLVVIILRYKDILGFKVNEVAPNSGKTALDHACDYGCKKGKWACFWSVVPHSDKTVVDQCIEKYKIPCQRGHT